MLKIKIFFSMLINAFDFVLEIFGIDFIARCWVLKVRLRIAFKIAFDYKATYFLNLQACLQTLKIRIFHTRPNQQVRLVWGGEI